MIEILTVIAIIALLLTITVIGMKHVGGNAKEKQARTVLEIMRSALSQAVAIDDVKAGDKFYGNVLPTRYNITAANAGTKVGGVSAKLLAAQAKTASIIRYLSSNAGAKTQIESLPPTLRKTVFLDINTQNVVALRNANTVDVTVPIDPWGNEIEFVYGNVRIPQGDSLVTDPTLGGLGEMYSKSALQYWRGPGSYSGPPVSGVTYNARPERALQAPDKGCFWVSAGPDGSFETHDDNLYSFEGN